MKERTWKEIEEDELEQESLLSILETADSYLSENPIPTAGEGFKSERRLKDEVLQRIIKEAHREYNGKCKIPEVRFFMLENGACISHIVGLKKKADCGFD